MLKSLGYLARHSIGAYYSQVFSSRRVWSLSSAPSPLSPPPSTLEAVRWFFRPVEAANVAGARKASLVTNLYTRPLLSSLRDTIKDNHGSKQSTEMDSGPKSVFKQQSSSSEGNETPADKKISKSLCGE